MVIRLNNTTYIFNEKVGRLLITDNNGNTMAIFYGMFIDLYSDYVKFSNKKEGLLLIEIVIEGAPNVLF